MNSSGVYRRVYETNIIVNPDNFYQSSYQATLNANDRVRREDFVRIGATTYSAVTLAKEGICDAQVSNAQFFPSSLGFPVTKGFPYLEMFNRRYVSGQKQCIGLQIEIGISSFLY